MHILQLFSIFVAYLNFRSPVIYTKRELAKQKRKDFIRAFDNVQSTMIANGMIPKIADICKLAASQEAPRFYVDAKTALNQYSRYIKGKSCIRHPERRKMYADIFSRFDSMIRVLPKSSVRNYRYLFMEKVLEQPAPSFYFTEGSAIKLYYRYMQDNRRKNKHR